MTELSLVQAVNLALKRAMADDSPCWCWAKTSASTAACSGRPTACSSFMAKPACSIPRSPKPRSPASPIGLAAQGFRPVAEIQFTGFAYTCIDQLINHASRLRARTRGRLSCPMVLRAPAGGGIKAVEHHSESPEAMFAHIPGLKVVIPSSPARAYGLLLSAIRDPDPVVFLEPTRLYRAAREDVTDDGAGLPLERCAVLRAGQGRDAGVMGRDGQGNAAGGRAARRRKYRGRGHRRADPEAARHRHHSGIRSAEPAAW